MYIFSDDTFPYGVFEIGKQIHIGVASGADILDLTACDALGLLDVPELKNQWVFTHPNLNALMKAGVTAWEKLRENIRFLCLSPQSPLQQNAEIRQKVWLAQKDVRMKLPIHIGDYTDFYASKHHASRVGTLFRGKDFALNENWLQMPIAYHGRASSVVLSGSPVYRPSGIIKKDETFQFQATQELDFEVESGCVIGVGNKRGQPIAIQDTGGHLFGLCLLNDWSARDIQRFEYQPLGPFLGKNFCTSISPWIIPFAALEAFKVTPQPQNPTPLSYLQFPEDKQYNIRFEVYLSTSKSTTPMHICSSNHQDLYWTPAQMLAHHSVNGCNLRSGDLLGSGTISGQGDENRGCLLEITENGTKSFTLPNGETRTYLQDGDTISLHAFAQNAEKSVYLGTCEGQIQPALS